MRTGWWCCAVTTAVWSLGCAGGDETESEYAWGSDTEVFGSDTESVAMVACGEASPAARSECTAGAAAVRNDVAFDSLEAALETAVPGATITLCPGTHTVSLTIDQDVVLVGYGPEESVLDGGGRRILEVDDSHLQLSGLTLTGGYAERNGGALNQRDGSLCLHEITFTGNQATYSGGAIELGGPSQVQILDSTFEGNQSGYQAGALSADDVAEMVVQDSTFSGNQAEYTGGALRFRDSPDVSLVDTTFQGNTSGYQAGAKAFHDFEDASAYVLALDEVAFLDNQAEHTAVLEVFGKVDVLLEGGALLGNASETEGVVMLDDTATLTASDVDFGTGEDENAPLDVGSHDFTGVSSFACRGNTCE